MSEKEIDSVTNVETTGHEWDGIKELNNPLPRWWVWVFYATIVFAIGYSIYYPAIPLIEGATKGVGGYSSRLELQQTMAEVEAGRADLLEEIRTTDVTEIQDNPELARFASAGGASAFKVYCSQCHGSGAQGAAGYPNLNDDDWLWGGSVDQIAYTIRHGVRYDEDMDTRYSEMPAFGEILPREEVLAVAHYVRSLSGLDHDGTAMETGTRVYMENCSACHGDNGLGNTDLGAPNLADALWLYGSSHQELVSQINNPKHGAMPAWGERLGDALVKQLAVYVHGLGGGE
ncbi:MAG: cytochrome-c oxidase, cbb3-type subunit III [Marinovum algicola]|uniref:cytochrome-c oxidase, cbb3-type subunit III n=1 Tax=Alphaproteobacteria TaxID=28211 RepID=UPI0032EDBD97